MARYLVTGGAGFIGSHIVEALVQRGDYVRVLDNFSTGVYANIPHLSSGEIIEGDLRNAETVRQATNGMDYVIHQAAIVSVPRSMADPDMTHAVNVNGTLNVLTAARQSGVKRVVLASSCAVYGSNNDLPLTESSLTRPLSPYAASKLIGEIYCQTFYRSYGLPTVCLRYFNVYGPRQNPEGDYAAVIPKFSHRIRAGLPPIIFGDGRQTRDFIFVGDVVRANLLVCEREESIGQIFNLASGHETSLLELVEILNKLCNTDFRPKYEHERLGDIQRSVGDSGQIALMLGFQANTPLERGLEYL